MKLQKMKFSIKISAVNATDLVTFTKEILKGKFIFCAVSNKTAFGLMLTYFFIKKASCYQKKGKKKVMYLLLQYSLT